MDRRLWSVCVGVALVAVGCASQPTPNGQTIYETAPQAGVPAYTASGPYPAGVRTLTLADRKVEVWYPADPTTTSGPTEVLDARDAFPPGYRTRIPTGLDLRWDSGAHRDAVAAAGAHPVVLNVHGFFLWRTASARLAAHLASWGMVVASADFPEFGLGTIETGLVAGDPVADLDAVVSRLTGEDRSGPLAGHLDLTQLAVMGHSFGALQATAYAWRPNVKVWLPLGAGAVPPMLFPDFAHGGGLKDSMWLAAGGDVTNAASSLPGAADATLGPREVVVMSYGGHVGPFTDLCLIGGDGLIRQLGTVGLDLAGFTSVANSGCEATSPDPAPSAATARHFITAELRWRFHLDAQPVGLGTAVVPVLPLPTTYSHRP